MQGKRIILAGIVGLITYALAIPTFAEMPAPYGWYVEGNVGSTNVYNKSYPGSASTSGWGADINLGYKFMPYFSMEAGYNRYATTTIKNSAGTKAGQDKHYSFDLTSKGIVPLSATGFELFGKLGIERVTSSLTISNATAASGIGLISGNHSTTGVYLGAGAEYYFTPVLAGIVQWSRSIGNRSTGTLDLVSVGASYIFA